MKWQNKYTRSLLAMIIMLLPLTMFPNVAFAEENSESKIDVEEIVLGHIGDSHEWHITTVGSTHVTIPLPVIVMDNNGAWHMFSSAKFHNDASGKYEGLYIPSDGANKGHVCEIVNDKETPVKIDISITKDVLQLYIVAGLMLWIFIGCARWYRKKSADSDAPKGFVGFIEMFVMMVNDDIIKPCIGEKHYRPYSPYLMTAFFFIFLCNIIGLVPIFPGGANLTGNIAITLFLALCTFLAINLFGNKEYWLDIFWPRVPLWLKCPIPMMPVIEFFGVFTKPFALMVRLFANIFAGHAIVLSLTCVIFISCQIGVVIGAGLSAVSVVMIIFMDCLELLVAFIQAYVFTMLSAVFIGLAHQEETPQPAVARE